MFSRLFAIILWVALCCSAQPANADSFTKQFIPTRPPRPVPMLTFEDSHGRTFSLQDFKGRYILLNLWASWCSPCVHEMPALDALRNTFTYRQFEVVALDEDHEGSSVAGVFYKRHSLQHMPIFIDTSGRTPSLLHATALPTTLFIDPQGMEIGRIEGEAEWSSPEAVSFITKWMQKSP